MRGGCKRAGWALAILLPVLFYFGVLWAAGGARPIGPPQTDYYNRLVHGILKGHLYLDTPVEARLLALPNAYDFTQRQSIPHLHDASLFHGRYYIYFGVTPLALLLLPFTWLTGHDLPIGYAVWLFVAAGYALALVLFVRIQRRRFPGAGRAARGVCLLGLAFGGAQLTLLARHSLYELPIASGSACFLAALVCLERALDAPRGRGWSAAAGLCLGLAVGCRPFYLLGALLFLLPFLYREPHRFGWRELGWAAFACACVGAGLAAYNAARFGSPFEFGQRYQLSDAIEANEQHFAWRYLPYNLRVYLFAPLQWGRYFPYVHGAALPPFPRGFGGAEWSYGVIPNLPFSLFAPIGLAISWRRLRLALVAASALLWFGLMCAFFGSVGRYLGDFMPVMAIEACVGLLFLLDRTAWSARLNAALLRFAGIAAGATALIAVLLAFTLYRSVLDNSPGLFAAAAQVGNAPVGLLEKLFRAPQGPLALTATLPAQIGRPEPLVTAGWPPEDSLWVTRIDSGQVQFSVSHGSGAPLPVGSPVAVEPGRPHSFVVSLGSLYPPIEHPYFWGRSLNQIASEKRWAKVAVDDRWVVQTLDSFTEPDPPLLAIGRGTPGSPASYSGKVLGVRRAAPPWSEDTLPSRDLIVPCRLIAEWAGRVFPLVTTGRPGQGDALEIEPLTEGEARLGYDHWGKAMIWSRPFPWPMGMTVPLHIHLARRGGGDPLVVRRGAEELWRLDADAYAISPLEIYPAVNATGASACEAALPPPTETSISR